MRVLWSSTVLALLCSACVAAPPPPVPIALSPVSDFQTKVSETDPNCRDYTGQAMIDGKEEQVVGHACKQEDGSWKVAEGTASEPAQFTAVYPAPIYAGGYYPDYFYGDPWFWDTSFGFGSSFVFFNRHFHHHGFHHGGFHHGGFGHGGGFHHR
jgi:hypothetical protein